MVAMEEVGGGGRIVSGYRGPWGTLGKCLDCP